MSVDQPVKVLVSEGIGRRPRLNSSTIPSSQKFILCPSSLALLGQVLGGQCQKNRSRDRAIKGAKKWLLARGFAAFRAFS
ncbi:MAG TPA: hypothetical protein VHF69_00685, partial [Candidatus Synoicihabitans sp.]|nr:hypothetical protein [Candidatus Synoicihabitans sp.]